GGTFDPIHHGHLVAASEVQATFDLDEVVFVPTGRPYQKDVEGARSPAHRYRWPCLARPSSPRCTASRSVAARPGPTSTIDTLRALPRSYGSDTELFFITGADALAQILTWKNVDELFSLAHFVGVSRPGHELHGDGLPVDRLSLVQIPALAISS